MLPGLGLGRRLVKLAAGVAVVVVAYLAVTAAQIWWTARQNANPHADAIIVMGAAQYNGSPSPDLVARLSHALALWRAGVATIVVVTGGRESGDPFTEAGVSATWLERRGVPRHDILAEKVGRDSYESIAAAVRALGRSRRIVVMVSDPFHEDRIVSMAQRLGLHAYPSPTRTSPIRGLAVLPYYARETFAVAIGRIIGYSTLSHIMHP